MSSFKYAKLVIIEWFESIFLKSLPTSLCQREEISPPPFVKGD
jgi:hypothetical protein